MTGYPSKKKAAQAKTIDEVNWVDHELYGLAQPEQEPVAWKLMPRDATDEMLKAMDECSTEGYDERLYAGHAASVYMAAWDEALYTTPPQRPWVEPTGNEWFEWWRISKVADATEAEIDFADFITIALAVTDKLKELNNG